MYTVVAVIGSTEESAVDPLKGVLELREEFRERGLEFTVHADAAWGGYHVSVLREDFDIAEPAALLESVAPPSMPLSLYVSEQFAAHGRDGRRRLDAELRAFRELLKVQDHVPGGDVEAHVLLPGVLHLELRRAEQDFAHSCACP